jgi:Icc-related predicted phosphoesterase
MNASATDQTGLMDHAITDRDDVRRVLIAGDTHLNTAWLNRLVDAAAENDCTVIVQVGDFGYFPEHRDGLRYLTAVEHSCAINGVELWFIDGNHDDHTSLANLDHNHLPVAVSDHVTYLPRGTRRRLGGAVFGFVGGAFSIDWRDRVAGRDWWPNEMTEASDVARLGLDPLDVLITHEAPAGVNLLSSWKLPAEDQVRADGVRSLIAQAVTTTTPRLVVHGHWHHGYDTELAWIDRAETERAGSLMWGSTRVVGLGCDGDVNRGWIVLEISTLDVHWP